MTSSVVGTSRPRTPTSAGSTVQPSPDGATAASGGSTRKLAHVRSDTERTLKRGRALWPVASLAPRQSPVVAFFHRVTVTRRGTRVQTPGRPSAIKRAIGWEAFLDKMSRNSDSGDQRDGFPTIFCLVEGGQLAHPLASRSLFKSECAPSPRVHCHQFPDKMPGNAASVRRRTSARPRVCKFAQPSGLSVDFRPGCPTKRLLPVLLWGSGRVSLAVLEQGYITSSDESMWRWALWRWALYSLCTAPTLAAI